MARIRARTSHAYPKGGRKALYMNPIALHDLLSRPHSPSDHKRARADSSVRASVSDVPASVAKIVCHDARGYPM